MRLSAVRLEIAKPQLMAVVRGSVPQDQLSSAIPAACGEVWTYARNARLSAPGRHVAVYLDSTVSFECGVEINQPFDGNGRVFCSVTPSGPVAAVTLIGPYSGLTAAHAAVREHCARLGHSLAGVNWEVYGHWTDDESQLQTDVYYLLHGPRHTAA